MKPAKKAHTPDYNVDKLIRMFDETPSFLCSLVGPKHTFEMVNKQFIRLVGRADIVGKTVEEALPEVVAQGFVTILDSVYKTGEPFYGNEVEVQLQREKKAPLETRYVNFVYMPTYDEGNKVTGIFVHGNDITEQVLSRKQAEESGEMFKSYAEAMPQMAFIANAKGDIIFFNQRWYEYVDGMVGTEGWGWKDKPIHHPDDLQIAIDRWSHSLKTGEPYEIQYRLRRHDGEYRWHLGRALPLRDKIGHITHWLGTNTDIHDQKRAMEQRDEFIGIASHELKTPLTSIKAYGQVLQKSFESEGNSKSVQMLKRMNEQITKLTTLVSDMLDVTKIESGKLVINADTFEFNELVRETVQDLQLTTNKHKIELELGKDIIIHCDRERIGQVITNFITNAIKYSPESDRIIVRTTSDKQCITFSVQDFGIGIPENQLQSIFEQFFRVQGKELKTIPGLGLGLYIASEIVRRQGGKIWVESESGKGSTFYFSLPRRCTSEEA